jgi:hypothetical protein
LGLLAGRGGSPEPPEAIEVNRPYQSIEMQATRLPLQQKQKRPAETGRLELINLNEPAFLNLWLRINATSGFRS